MPRVISLQMMFLLITILSSFNWISPSDTQQSPIASDIIKDQKSRIEDKYGSGQYGASRDANKRKHNGLDVIVTAGEEIKSPITGSIIRQAFPYKNDKNYEGIVIKGDGEWSGYEIKIFYVKGLFSGKVVNEQVIGHAQDLTVKYPKITNHVHIEVRVAGTSIDPFELWQYSF